ncbi:MAG: AAA family ATPase, partial [Nitrospirae bacterium RBG_13_39_12]
MEDILYRYNPWWEGRYTLEGIIERDEMLSLMKKYFSSRQVVFLTGLRRVGKTTLLRLFIKSLIDLEGIDVKHILYVSLDDYLLSRYTILEIVEKYRKIQKIRFRDKIILFLDEITYKKDFEIQLKNFYDSQNVKIYASSSSSSLMKGGKPYLTGRRTIIEILPLDFGEFMHFRKIALSKADSHLLESYFEEFMWTGGIPEFVLRGDVEYLKELVDDIIYKDIAAVYSIKNPDMLKDYFLLMMERAGKTASINKIAHILKISPDTAKRYFEMFA